VAEETSGERTEEATPRQLEKAREKGQVAKSQELNSFFVLGAGTVMLLVLTPWFLETLGDNAGYLFSQAHVLRPDNLFGLQVLLEGNLENLLAAMAPFLAVVLVAAVGANVVQVGLKVSPAAMNFNAGKLNPITGMKRFFQKRTFFELVKTLLKVLLISLLAGAVIRALLGDMTASATLPLPGIIEVARSSFVRLMAVLLFLVLVLAVADWSYQKWQHAQDLKMSKQDVKQEHKEFEGDPQIRARIRSIQMEMARKRMLADVPRADVVVTNPTHFAVALKYESGTAAPVVLAKGADEVAQKIKAIARGARVPVIENKPVARALYRQVEVGRAIPETLYQAVAEILAYVYRLKKA